MENKNPIQYRTITDFLNNEYFDYSMYVIENRACPSVVDGFKTGARKILHAAMKGSLKNGETKKVTALSGETMTYSLYQHGDASLSGTIITISQDFNFNLNPLYIDGQNGSLRSQDAASPRYLYVRHSKYTDIWKTDYDLLEFEEEEGQKVEPKYYLPIIPVILTAGQIGMAPGYKFSCIPYNPLNIIDICSEYIKTGSISKCARPYIRGIKTYNWKLVTAQDGENYWMNYGEWSYNKSKDLMYITDLPYDMTFNDFETLLNKYVESNYIKDWKDYSKNGQINYIVQFESGRMKAEIGDENTDTRLPNKFKLIKKVPADNLWVIDENKKVKHFLTPNDLIKYFVDFRLKKYNDRKTLLISVLEKRLDENSNLCKFIKLIIENKIKINNRPKAEIKEDLKKHDLPESLLSVPISKLTKEEYEALLKENEDIKQEIAYIKNTTIQDMYLKDLSELRKKIEKDFPEDDNPNKTKFEGTFKQDKDKEKLEKLKEKEKKTKEKVAKDKEKAKKEKDKAKAKKEKEKAAKEKEKAKKAKEKEKAAKEKEKAKKAKEKEKRAKEKEKLEKQKAKLEKQKAKANK
jgi:DNA topoisomerase-2